jgi:hypothetical protein
MAEFPGFALHDFDDLNHERCHWLFEQGIDERLDAAAPANNVLFAGTSRRLSQTGRNHARLDDRDFDPEGLCFLRQSLANSLQRPFRRRIGSV